MSDFSAIDRRAGFVWIPWLVCLSAGLFFLFEFFQLNVFDVINQSLRDEFHIDAAQLSWMSSAYVWANVIFLLPAGVILDRFSARIVILVAMLSCVLGTIGFAVAQHFISAVIFHALTGVGNAFCFLSCVVLVSRWFPPRRQAFVIGCIVTMAFIGGMMAHTPLAYLSAEFGWRRALLMDGVMGALLLLWIFFTVKDKPLIISVSLGDGYKPSYFSGLVSVFRNRQNWLAGVYTACLNLPIMVLCALWGASYLQQVHHLSDLDASNVVSLIFVGSIVGCPLVGFWSDRLGRRKPLLLFGAIATLLTLFPLFCNISLSYPVLSAIFFLLGFVSSTQVISYPLIAESNELHHTGLATGLASVLIMAGGGFGQVLFGLLIRQHAGASMLSYSAADFQWAMWMFPIAVGVALLAVMGTYETYCKPCYGSHDAHD